MKELVIKIMKDCGIEGDPANFVEAVGDFLSEYAEHIEGTEPNAFSSISALKDAHGSVVGLWMSGEVD